MINLNELIEKSYHEIKNPIFKAQAKKLLKTQTKKEKTLQFMNLIKKLIPKPPNKKTFRQDLIVQFFTIMNNKSIIKEELEKIKLLIFLSFFLKKYERQMILPKYVTESFYVGLDVIKTEIVCSIKFLAGWNFNAFLYDTKAKYLNDVEIKLKKIKFFIEVIKNLNYKTFREFFDDLEVFENKIIMCYAINVVDIKSAIEQIDFFISLQNKLIENDILLYLNNSIEMFQVSITMETCNKNKENNENKKFNKSYSLVSFIEFLKNNKTFKEFNSIKITEENLKQIDSIFAWQILINDCIQNQIKNYKEKS